MERLPVSVPEPQDDHPPNALAHGVPPLPDLLLPEQACHSDAVESKRCAFERVPKEILDRIVSYLACADVARLVRTSRAFFNSTDTETALYRHLEFSLADRPISRLGLAHLALKLLERRARVFSIRSFKLMCEDAPPLLQFTFEPSEIYPLIFPLTPSHVELHKPVRDAGAQNNFLNSMERGGYETLSLLLLSLMPNVVELCIDTRIFHYPGFIESLVILTSSAYQGERSKADFGRHLPLPHLRSLEIEVDSPDPFSGSLIFDALRILVSKGTEDFPLTELSVAVYGPPADLGKFLSLCPKLKVFKYTHLWATKDDVFDLRYLFDDLVLIKTHVEKLTITGKDEGPDGPFPRFSHILNRRFGTLRNFQRLTELEIPWVLLTEHCAHTASGLKDLLPPNLEILTINDFLARTVCEWLRAEGSRDIRFIEYLCDWRQHTPRLRRIIWKGTFNFWTEKSVEHIRAMYTFHGITWIQL